MINLFNCDCMNFMKTKPDKYYDLAIVDPPYNDNFIKFDYATGRNEENYKTKKQANIRHRYISEGMSNKPNKEYFDELLRVSKNQIIWGANFLINEIPLKTSCWIVWDKINSGNFADCELALTSFNSAVRKFSYCWNGMIQQDMKNKQNRIHPTENPVALYEWLLDKYAQSGDKILDTHGGSMSIAIACHNLGFDLDCCELDKDYFEQAKSRFEKHCNQIRLTDIIGG